MLILHYLTILLLKYADLQKCIVYTFWEKLVSLQRN